MHEYDRPAQTRVARHCYLLLRAEIGRRLAEARRWQSLPGLLDELDALRRLHDGGLRVDADTGAGRAARGQRNCESSSTVQPVRTVTAA